MGVGIGAQARSAPTKRLAAGRYASNKKVIMNAQCNALYGTAPSRRDCLTTLKSSEGNSRHSAFLYRNAAPYAMCRNCISLTISRFTPPHKSHSTTTRSSGMVAL